MFLYGGKESLRESTKIIDEEMTSEQLTPYVELLAYDEMSRLPDDEIATIIESGDMRILQERQVLNKGTMMRLSKADDEKRRIKLIAYKLAKDDKYPNWGKMNFHRGKWKFYRDDILKKYGKRAEKIAKMAQKEYIKRAKKEPAKKKK